MSDRKGIILAGGSGTRLHPITVATSKQLLPVYDKPMIYYPLSVLMLSGIRDILIITTSEDHLNFKKLLGNGKQLGININYEIQPSPDGLAQAFIIGEDFIGNDDCCLVLGDNIFYGQHFTDKLINASMNKNRSTIFAYHVKNPSDFGVVEFDPSHRAISIEEKPKYPKSNFAITGLYFYSNDVIDFAKSLKPSSRGELEISDINKLYMHQSKLDVEILGRGFAWLDTGNCDSLIKASEFVKTIESSQGLKIACIEEIAYRQGWIDKPGLEELAKDLKKTNYGEYLLNLI